MGKEEILSKKNKLSIQKRLNHSGKDKKNKPTQQRQILLAKEVEKVFNKVCQSLELYKTDNIPIVTEFLEF